MKVNISMTNASFCKHYEYATNMNIKLKNVFSSYSSRCTRWRQWAFGVGCWLRWCATWPSIIHNCICLAGGSAANHCSSLCSFPLSWTAGCQSLPLLGRITATRFAVFLSVGADAGYDISQTICNKTELFFSTERRKIFEKCASTIALVLYYTAIKTIKYSSTD